MTMDRLSGLWAIPGRVWAALMSAAPAKTWLTAGAGIAWTLMSAGLVWLFRPLLGTNEAFWVIESALGIVLVAIASLAGMGVSFRAGKDGVSANLGDGDEETVKVTATATIEAPKPATPAQPRSLEDPA